MNNSVTAKSAWLFADVELMLNMNITAVIALVLLQLIYINPIQRIKSQS